MSENETPSMPKLTYSLGRLAVLLAMSENREEENLWKELITKQNYKCVATEVSGTLDDFLNNVIKNAVTAALRTNVIEQSVKDIHAINHAVLEAMNGVIPTSMAPNLNL
ncbi:MAG: hypothetical protein GXX92_11885, partial [Clostridiales bacterium]|nr:hypothetical protein [Clostridiales bacterium]